MIGHVLTSKEPEVLLHGAAIASVHNGVVCVVGANYEVVRDSSLGLSKEGDIALAINEFRAVASTRNTKWDADKIGFTGVSYFEVTISLKISVDCLGACP